jgi:DNA (cytosine-5)-methyltransferase 1
MGIPVIDLFAGPGGLGEGFSFLKNKNGNRVFNIKLSIEKDEYARQTLRLRSFYRQFHSDNIPEIYYDFVKENNRIKQVKILNLLQSEYPVEWENAEKEAWHFELPFLKEEKQRLKYDSNGNPYYEKYYIGYSEKEILNRHKEIDQRISEALNNQRDFLLIGGPPCQAYSLVGRARNQGISKTDHRVHLYKEYLRIIAKHHPAAFVMENVKGLLSAEVEGKKVFDLIKMDLQNPESVFPELNPPKYRIYSFVNKPDEYDDNGFPVYHENSKYLIKTENFEIPQKRHRVILFGIREDLLPENIGVLDICQEINLINVIDELPRLRSGIGRYISAKNEKGNHIYSEIENSQGNWEQAVTESINRLRKEFTELKIEDYTDFPKTQGANFIERISKEDKNRLYENWFLDERLNGVLNHETRTHLREDLCRYLFSSIFLEKNGDFPKLKDYPDWLLPEHKNAKGGKFTDRFRTQKPDEPATTVTSHISKDGHYFIHYDPIQCRSLTVREAARIQTFPDNYYFCGTRTEQYHQVGNAVPPYLAKQLAEIVKSVFQNYERKKKHTRSIKDI